MSLDIYHRILNIDQKSFDDLTIEIFQYQSKNNPVYKEYLSLLKKNPDTIDKLVEIPFLPIELYKTSIVKTGEWVEEAFFLSSGTSSSVRSKNFIRNLDWYQQISYSIFEKQVLNSDTGRLPELIIGYLPGYINNPHSSLVKMIRLIGERMAVEVILCDKKDELVTLLKDSSHSDKRLVLFGVSFALYDLAREEFMDNANLSIIETGGMKTDSRSIDKSEILHQLNKAFPSSVILSEYGMTELMSQAYSMDGINYTSAPWFKIMISAIDDPTTLLSVGRRGRINIIDLANVDTCSFVQTADAGILNSDETFNILGRIDDQELRGCNLMIEN